MSPVTRRSIQKLSIRDYCLYRAICMELDELQKSILHDGLLQLDFEALAVERRDQRLLIEWLRELRFPPSAAYIDTGLNLEQENELLRGTCIDS